MQLRKMSLMLTVLGAVGMMLAGCGGGETKSLTCSADTDCLESELCHPDAKVCVQKCTSSAECPDTAKTCDVVSTTNSQKICKCSTDALCNTGRETANLACSTTYNVCVPTCTTDTDCAAGQTCDTTTKQCKSTTTTPPEGQACTGEGQTTCGYGQFCSSSKCTSVPTPTCANFDPSKGGKTPVFNPATSTGPIIYQITKLYFRPETTADYPSPFCGTNDVVKVQLKAYQSGTNTFPSSSTGLNGLFYVTVGGDETAASNLVRPSDYSVSADKKQATINVSVCPAPGSTTISLGFYFTGGNEICSQVSK